MFKNPAFVAEGAQLLKGINLDDAISNFEWYKGCLRADPEADTNEVDQLKAELMEWIEAEGL